MQLWLRSSKNASAVKVTNFSRGVLSTPVWSPDNVTVALPDGNRRLWLIDVRSKVASLVATEQRGFITDPSFSQDGRWLAYSASQANGLSGLHLYDVQMHRDFAISSPMNSDRSPVFADDGSYLVFISARHEIPFLSERESDFTMVNSEGIYVVPLQGLKSGSRYSEQALSEIKNEVTPLPVEAGKFEHLSAVGTALYFIRRPLEDADGEPIFGNSRLETFDLRTKLQKSILASVTDYAINSTGTSLLTVNAGAWAVRTASGPNGEYSSTAIATNLMRADVDPKMEWSQMLREVWRLDRDMFTNPKIDSPAWVDVYDQYSSLLPLVGSKPELTWLISQVQGELAASHTFVTAGDIGDDAPRTSVALLGVDFGVNLPDGRVSLDRIYRGDNSRPELRSPLSGPGVDVRDGDLLIGVNGRSIDSKHDPYMALSGLQAPVVLTIEHAGDTITKQVAVEPLRSEVDLRQEYFIATSRERVDRLSRGRVGYVYMTDLHSDGLKQFIRQLNPQINKQGFIFDVRWNQGGSFSQPILERLSRSIQGAFVNRQGGIEPLPDQALALPKVALVNRFTRSDGDQFAFYFRAMHLGKVVGERTWGGTWGVGAPWRLLDGALIGIPKDALVSRSGDWVIENLGVAPDISLHEAPGDLLPGVDVQLDEAVRLIDRKAQGRRAPVKPKPFPNPSAR